VVVVVVVIVVVVVVVAAATKISTVKFSYEQDYFQSLSKARSSKNPNLHYSVNKSPAAIIPYPDQAESRVHLNVLPSVLRLRKWYHSFRFSDQHNTSIRMFRITQQSYTPRFSHSLLSFNFMAIIIKCLFHFQMSQYIYVISVFGHEVA
jgi:hypothetical protein